MLDAGTSLSVTTLRELLFYQPETGAFQWKANSGRAIAGAAAGTMRHNGYLGITIQRRRFMSHRLAWLYVYATWPRGQIDHINGCRSDNRIENLRDVDWETNAQNMRHPSKASSTGVLGIYPVRNGFAAKISVDGKSQYLGSFQSHEDASAAYLDAKRKLHPGCTL